MDNPLLLEFNGPFGAVPFDQIKAEHFIPALKSAIAEALKEIQVIVDNKERPDFENTLLALEESGAKLSRCASIFFNLHSAETNMEMQAIAPEFSALLTQYRNDVTLNPALFSKLKSLWERREALGLDPEQERLLEKSYRAFSRNGADLAPEHQAELRRLDERLAALSLQFGENLLAETNDFQLFCSRERLAGLPENALDSAAEEATAAGREGEYLISLQAPSYLAVMTYAEDRSLREELFRAYGRRAYQGNAHDNRKTVSEIVQLRAERAKLLGFPHHAEYVLSERMAGSTEQVEAFLARLEESAAPAAESELEALAAFARERDGLESLARWDFNFYSEKLKQKRYSVDDEQLKPYFELSRVLQGAFAVAKKLYGIEFQKREDIPIYHPDVQTFEVLDHDGSHLALLYADFYPRAGKRNGAWMTSYREQGMKQGQDERPHVSIVCNFTKPSKNSPALLTFNEVLTLFHEFGHALHGMLARGRYRSLSGTNVLWDFVELPSQIMENWCYQKEALDLFAHHYQSGAALDPETIERLRQSASFMEGYATLRQISFAKLDLAWHRLSGAPEGEVGAFEDAIMSDYQLLAAVDHTNMSCSFAHIFQGGYSAGYYSYKWAEVLDADAFELFQARGLFDAATAASFRRLLESGDAVHPAELYRRFRGQDPDPGALLRRAGLVNSQAKRDPNA